VIAHRQNVLAAVDRMLVMAEGKARSFGPKDEVLGKLGNRVARPAVLRASATLAPSGQRDTASDANLAEVPIADLRRLAAAMGQPQGTA
jgi:hypothetical protein